MDAGSSKSNIRRSKRLWMRPCITITNNKARKNSMKGKEKGNDSIMNYIKKAVIITLFTTLAVMIRPCTAKAETVKGAFTITEGDSNCSYDSNLLTITGDCTVKNTTQGTTSDHIKIDITNDCTVTLAGVNIESSSAAPILINIANDKTLTLKLSEKNTVKATGDNYAGYDIDSAENIGNGYEFCSMKVGTVDKEDDENNTVGSFKDISIEYSNGTYTIDADISQIQPEDEDTSAMETKQSGDITLSYFTDHYKFVPADYELTDEDKQNETQDHYYISYGTNEIEEHDYQYVSWKKGDLNYLLSAKDLSLSSDEMFEMAEKYLEGSDGLADNPQE